MEYKTVTNRDNSWLDKEITQLISQNLGWELRGGVSVAIGSDNINNVTFVQALVRKKPIQALVRKNYNPPQHIPDNASVAGSEVPSMTHSIIGDPDYF